MHIQVQVILYTVPTTKPSEKFSLEEPKFQITSFYYNATRIYLFKQSQFLGKLNFLLQLNEI